MNQPLFRSQVLAERKTRWLGTVLLTRPLSHAFFAGFALLAMTAVLALLALGEFTRKARVSGWLVPQQGMVKVFAPQAGVIGQVRVKEGAMVARGDALLVLSAELRSTARGATQAEIARLLTARRDSLATERTQQERLFAQQAAALERRVESLRAERSQLEREIGLQGARARLAEQSLARQRQLHAQGFLSLQQVQQQQEQSLEQRSRLLALERSLLSTRGEIVALEAELADLPLKAQAQIAATARSISALEQDLAEAEVRREIVITAPQPGVVTSIQAEAGGNATPATPLLSIVPAGATLEARLFAPSRAIGFVRPGQRVLLRYQAYPYQKFGHHEGHVEAVSRSAASPAELPPQLAGLSSLYGTSEPIYGITVRLRRQEITAYGQAQPLRPGMLLEADILMDRRRLYEWMLEPLYTLTGRL